ncbi:MAG: HNH endonuclease signature motif containing protein [Nanoarchaeota archaeon]
MAKQRETKNLGLNRSKNREKIFRYIEDVLGIKEKRCGMVKMTKYGFKHFGRNPLPIRNFNLRDVNIVNGKVILGSQTKDGLQPNCMACERKYRRGRLDKHKLKYEGMTDKQIYDNYKKEYNRTSKRCSMCKIEKDPSEFPISRGMETGLHNTCKACSKSYSESVGGRWIIYSVDGHEVMKITNKDSCAICGSKDKLHKDHIFPVSKGGTDNKENLQILCREHNLSKSNTIISPIIKSVKDIKNKMICERYLPILRKARKENWSLVKFESEITKAVREFIIWKRESREVCDQRTLFILYNIFFPLKPKIPRSKVIFPSYH